MYRGDQLDIDINGIDDAPDPVYCMATGEVIIPYVNWKKRDELDIEDNIVHFTQGNQVDLDNPLETIQSDEIYCVATGKLVVENDVTILGGGWLFLDERAHLVLDS